MAATTLCDATLEGFAAPYLAEWGALWGAPGLDTQLRVVASARLRTTVGLCRPARAELEVAKFLLRGPESLLLEVLCHEAAHAVVHARHGRRVRPHGQEWQRLMRAAGYPSRARLPEHRLAELPAEARRQRILFEHRCPSCGRRRMAGRSVRVWRCGPCNRAGGSGELVITRRPME